MSIDRNKGGLMKTMMEITKTALPFEQQRRESAKAFAAFRAYLDMGPERSTRAVGEKLGKSEGLMERWAAKFDWRSRVQAHAAHLAELERKAIESVAVEKAVEWARMEESVRRECWQEADATIVMVRKARAEWMAKGRLPGWEGMARMLELALKLKQFAAGMPSVVKEVNTHITGTIDVDWEIAIRKAYGEKAQTLKTETLKAEVVEVEEVGKAQGEDGGLKIEDRKEAKV